MGVTVDKHPPVDVSGTSQIPFCETQFGTFTTHLVTPSNINVYMLFVQMVETSLMYFQLFQQGTNLAANIAGKGVVPYDCFEMGAGSATAPTTLILGRDYFGNGGELYKGLVWGISSTIGYYTATGTAANWLVKIRGQ